jgi:hypothetical protein
MMNQTSANESFELIVWSLGRRCRWRVRAVEWSLSRGVRSAFAGGLGLAGVVVMSGALGSLVATVERGLSMLGR